MAGGLGAGMYGPNNQFYPAKTGFQIGWLDPPYYTKFGYIPDPSYVAPQQGTTPEGYIVPIAQANAANQGAAETSFLQSQFNAQMPSGLQLPGPGGTTFQPYSAVGAGPVPLPAPAPSPSATPAPPPVAIPMIPAATAAAPAPAPTITSTLAPAPTATPTPAPTPDLTPAPIAFPFQEWLDTNPQIAYQGALGDNPALTGQAQKNYFKGQFSNIQDQYFGSLARAAQANPGVAPTEHFSDYLKNFDWTNEFYKQSPEQRGSGQQGVKTQFLY